MPNIAMDLTDRHATLTAAPGDTVDLRLNENPSTGYGWQRVAPLPDGIVELKSSFIQDSPPAGSQDLMTGAGGTRVFHYRCDRATTGQLAFQLFPPGRQTTPVEGRSVTLTCR